MQENTGMGLSHPDCEFTDILGKEIWQKGRNLDFLPRRLSKVPQGPSVSEERGSVGLQCKL
jgi:hypothetical protein